MPNLNQTGPNGQGAMTGRQLGRCTHFGKNRKIQDDLPNANVSETQQERPCGPFFGGHRAVGRGGFGRGQHNRFRGGFNNE